MSMGMLDPIAFASFYSIVGPHTPEMVSWVKCLVRTQSYNTVVVEEQEGTGRRERLCPALLSGSNPQSKHLSSGYILLSSVHFIPSPLPTHTTHTPLPAPSSSRSGQTFSAPPYSLSGPVCLPSPGETLKIETSFEEKTV